MKQTNSNRNFSLDYKLLTPLINEIAIFVMFYSNKCLLNHINNADFHSFVSCI